MSPDEKSLLEKPTDRLSDSDLSRYLPQGKRLDDLPHELVEEHRSTLFGTSEVIGDRFEVTKLLGFGGMGAVYMVTDRLMRGQTKALKVMLPSLVASDEARKRFISEAQIAQSLRHDGIVAVYDIGEEKNLLFFTMEFLEGENLNDWLVRGNKKLRVREACEIMLQVCESLNYAHRRGVIHRDIKPQNIYILPDGSVKLLDFGIAKLMSPGKLTSSSVGFGTAYYMGPEQALGREADHRSDIFSVGVVFYRVLVGEVPMGRFELPSEIDGAIPHKIDVIIERCLKTKPEDRYGDINELAAALREVLADLEQEERKQEEKRRRRIESHFQTGKEMMATGSVDRAIEEFDALLSLEPEHQEGRAFLEKAREEKEHKETKRKRIEAQLTQAKELLGSGKFERAAEEIRILLAIDPAHEEGLRLLARATAELETREAERKRAEEEKKRKEEEARLREEDEKRKKEEEARHREEEEKRKKEEEARRKAEEERKKIEEESRRKAQEEERKKAEEERRLREEEQKRRAEEEKRKAEEAKRRAEEEKAKAEEERRKKLEAEQQAREAAAQKAKEEKERAKKEKEQRTRELVASRGAEKPAGRRGLMIGGVLVLAVAMIGGIVMLTKEKKPMPSAPITAPAPPTETAGPPVAPEPAVSPSAEPAKVSPPPEEPAVPAVDEKGKKINELLAKAEEYFFENRLVTPDGKNAYECYRQVLLIDSENPAGREGISRVKDKCLDLGDREYKGDNYEKAKEWYVMALEVAPIDEVVKTKIKDCDQKIEVAKLSREPERGKEVAPVPPQAPPPSPVAETKPGKGSIKLAKIPSGTRIYLDGNLRREPAGVLTEIDPGPHQLKFVKEGYKPWEAQVEVKPGETTPVAVLLEKAPSPAAPEKKAEVAPMERTPAAAAPKKRISNSVGMNFAYVSPGVFVMGSPADEKGRKNDEVPHQVTLTRGFYLQTTEVTQGQWKAVMGGNPAAFPEGDYYPVENVSWEDCQDFVRRLNQREGTSRYRLPTEAEWEYACRAGSTVAFTNGGISETECGSDPQLTLVGWYCGNAEKKIEAKARRHMTVSSGFRSTPEKSYNLPSAAAQKQPNGWGFFDMHGNVAEWCEDGYGSYAPGNVSDPIGAGGAAAKVYRGGAWDSAASLCRAAARSASPASDRSNNRGLRLACTP